MKTGYRLEITTWENDADNYMTKSHDGLSFDQTKFLISVCELFYSRNRTKSGRFGNAECSMQEDSELPHLLYDLAVKCSDLPKGWDRLLDPSYQLDDSFEHFYYVASDLCDDLIGNWCDGEYWRVFESFKVFYIPVPIEEVTEQFK